MTITKCRIWALKVSCVTVAARALRVCAHTSDGWAALAWMETIMNTTNDASRELPENELDVVSGGAFPLFYFLASRAGGGNVRFGDIKGESGDIGHDMHIIP
jgi:hypothetical protein